MATPKTITINDIGQQRLYLQKAGNDLLVQRDYVFLDSQGSEITILGTQVFETTVPISSIPANILAALQTIDTFVYNQILAKEGMS